MPVDEWSGVMALAVNTLGGGIVGASVALCCVKKQSPLEGLTRTIVSVIVSGCAFVPTIRLIRWKWPDVTEDFALRFGVQLVWGLFGFYLVRWSFNEFEGTESMKLSAVIRRLLKSFGPVFARIGPWMTRLGNKEDK
jgi:hypothetical protein